MNRLSKSLVILTTICLVVAATGCTGQLSSPRNPTLSGPASAYDLISEDSLFGYLEDLTSIQPYSGWRNSASTGEREALDYVEAVLGGFSYITEMGMELERQSFDVFLSTEIWNSGITVTVKGKDHDIPAEGLRGSRFDRSNAAYFDSDGSIYDLDPDPQSASGVPLVVRDDIDLYSLQEDQVRGRILFLDYSLIDYTVSANPDYTTVGAYSEQIATLVNQGLAGVVIVIQYSNDLGESRGTILGDGATFQSEVPLKRVPFLYVRMENLQSAGINSWDDIHKIESVSLLLDSDVSCPGTAGNVIARIPGADSTRAVILGAHIDSPNTPGAFDDGSGSATLLEIARVLDASRVQPPVDVYLAWFGGHEIGVYGSAYFAATHQELLDRTLGQFQMDGLGHPLENGSSKITMMMTSYGQYGDERVPLADFLSEMALEQGIALDRYVEYGLIADNSSFDMFNVPNVFLGYLNSSDWRNKGSTFNHYSNHWHDPYETVEIVREVGDVFVEMTKVMLAAALEIDDIQANTRVPPVPDKLAVIIASHSEPASAITSLLRHMGMSLAWAGFDVDLIPFGQPVSPEDLQGADILILPPSMSLPGETENVWSGSEFSALENYVAEGGFLVAINSAYTFAMARQLAYPNPESLAFNPLLSLMGAEFSLASPYEEGIALAVTEHPLTQDASDLAYFSNDVVSLILASGLELFRAGGTPVASLLDYGNNGGQVLVISDIGLLQLDSPHAKNLQFLKNIALYAASR